MGRARGRVLDLGMGFDHLGDYQRHGSAESLVVLERNAYAADRLARRATNLRTETEVRQATLSDLDPSIDRFDTVVSVFGLALVRDLPLSLRAIQSLLTADGRLEFVEPVADFHSLDPLLSALSPLLRATAGLHLDRDVPSAIRAVGYTLDRVERTTMPTFIWPLRHVASGSARRAAGTS